MSIKISDVSFKFRGKLALNNVSLSLSPGFNVLLGPNGAGKSTLLSLLTAQRPLQSGTLTYGTHDINQHQRAIMAQIGVVFQQTTLDLDLSVKQNLTYFGALHGLTTKRVLDNLSPVLESLALLDRLDDKIRALNEGHRRRVEIARCMIHQPQYLLLDEATVGLDVDSRKLIIEHIRALAKTSSLTILWTTHLMDEVQEDDALFIMNQGEIVTRGQCGQLLNHYKQENVFDLYRYLTQPEGLI